MNEAWGVRPDAHLLSTALADPSFVEGTNLGLLLLDTNGLIIDVNPTAMAQASLSREEFLARVSEISVGLSALFQVNTTIRRGQL